MLLLLPPPLIGTELLLGARLEFPTTLRCDWPASVDVDREDILLPAVIVVADSFDIIETLELDEL